MMKKFLLSALFTGTVLLTSCTKEKPDEDNNGGFLHGAYISSEGAFGNSNGSISYFDTDSVIMHNHLFEAVNGRPLGDVVQSVSIAGDRAYIVVNNSQKLEVVDLKTFESVGVIEGLEYPRYFLGVSDTKGYLTDGNFTGRVLVIDLVSLKVTDTIPCGGGPEKLIRYKNSVLVANSGGWGNDNSVTVIDVNTDEVSATWEVGMDPVDMVLDRDNQLWVLCRGKIVWNPDYSIGEETSSTLVSMNPETGVLNGSTDIGVIGDYYWPLHMAINKNRDRVFYLESNGIFSRGTAAGSNSELFISGSLYGFGIDPSTDMIYGLSAPSFTTSGLMMRYSADGQAVDSLEVGIGPSGVVFN